MAGGGSGTPFFSAQPKNFWRILGNEGTVEGTNFLGTIDTIPLDIRTDNITRINVRADGDVWIPKTLAVGQSADPDADFVMVIRNGPDLDGLHIMAGENLGDIALRIADDDDSFNILDIEADQGYAVWGITYAAAVAATTNVFGIDIRHTANNAQHFNAENGAYYIGGVRPDTQVNSASSTSTGSGSYVLINATTVTPGAGTYMVFFSASGRGTSDNQEMQYSLFANSTVVSHTERDLGFEANNLNEDKRLTLHSQKHKLPGRQSYHQHKVQQ